MVIKQSKSTRSLHCFALISFFFLAFVGMSYAEQITFNAKLFNSSPWVSRADDGTYVGIMPEFYQMMTEKTGFKFDMKTGNLKKIYKDFETNNADLTICFIVHQPPNSIVVGVINELEQGFITTKGTPLNSMEDMKGKRVGVLRGTYTGIPDSIKHTDVGIDTNEAGIKMLMAGRLDYLYFFGGMQKAAKNAGFSMDDFGTKLIVKKEPYGFFLCKTSKHATEKNIQKLRKAFQELKDAGEYVRLEKKWF